MHANDTHEIHDLPDGSEAHRTHGRFWFVGDGSGSFVRLTDAAARELARLSAEYTSGERKEAPNV